MNHDTQKGLLKLNSAIKPLNAEPNNKPIKKPKRHFPHKEPTAHMMDSFATLTD